ncbi:hypothetical protein C3Y87_11495 [Carbonactinospora thermoautotrophica]|uniref:Putative zinc-finger domain-containing protein n=3 Tax=Carbonactinospora thermoautotrophica TaxID=1469144 RepID=A0A132MJC1_9ACTN|nr:zf-HC2 domain-containing protein [Carbonactinospora thermoautotrophica]KWW97849.1 hypothetical protein TH66_20735 [Carbonactinospora thermoautotrophica]MCX9192026.1 hypothetical protein [Carbonactinospora thermoautotrophica]
MTEDSAVSTRWTAGHPDPETISDYLEGLLSRPAARRVEVHLRRCGSCRDTQAALGEVRELLAASDAGPMPPQVAARIEAALASPGERVSGDAGPTTPGEPAASMTSRKRSRRSAWLLRAAAAVAVVAAGVGIVPQLLPGVWPRQNSATSTNAPAPARSGQPGSGGQQESSPRLSGLPGPVLYRGRPYAAAQFGTQVHELLREAATIRPFQGRPPSGSQGGVPYDGDAASVVGCVREATGRPGDPPVVVDFGTYEGRQAAVVVLHDETNPALLDAYVVPASCPAHPPVLVRQVMLP